MPLDLVIEDNYGDARLIKELVSRCSIVIDVVANIDHIAKVAGIDHVGIGTDFDGVGDDVAKGLEDGPRCLRCQPLCARRVTARRMWKM